MFPLVLQLFFAEPGPPLSVGISQLAARSVVFGWKPPLQSNGNISSYHVFVKQADGRTIRQADEGETRHIVKSNESSLTLTTLKPYTTYHVQVIAVTIRSTDNQELFGQRSNVTTFTTKQSGTYFMTHSRSYC